jgi:hypothetical protein
VAWELGLVLGLGQVLPLALAWEQGLVLVLVLVVRLQLRGGCLG